MSNNHNNFYTGSGVVRSEPIELPDYDLQKAVDPEGYVAEEGLVAAVNVALLLGKPLLLTGEPGTGKTQLARSLAAELGLGEPLRFDAKSTSQAKDLFYTYDAISRFHAAQTKQGSQRTIDYITFNALGKAILLTNEVNDICHLLVDEQEQREPRRAVVLIDEVDKAPRDFPNDVLAELEEMSFRIPELANVQVSANKKLRPVVVVTSNSEKHLPDAFLRRCVFYDIEFPGDERLSKILTSRVGQKYDLNSDCVQTVLEVFQLLRRSTPPLRKKPATAELIEWVAAIRESDGKSDNPLKANPECALDAMGVLVKFREDMPRARQILEDWVGQHKKK